MRSSMKRYFVRTLMLILACVGFVGCSKPELKLDLAAGETTRQMWKLSNGQMVNCSVSYYTKSGDRAWIWCDAPRDPVSYKITGGLIQGDWILMHKIRVSNDAKLEAIPDSKGMFGDAVKLQRGKYKVSFKIGDAEFSALTLMVQ